MSIEKMKKLRLVAVSAQREALLRELMLLGCVEIAEPAEGEAAGLARVEPAELAGVKARHGALQNALKLLDKYAPEKKKLLAPAPSAGLDELLDESSLPEAVAAAEKIISLDEELRRLSAEESRERSVRESLLPWAGLDLPLDFRGTERADALLCSLPLSADMAEAEGTLGAECPESQLFVISNDDKLRYCVLVSLRESGEAALAALRPFGLTLMTLPDEAMTPREAATKSAERLDAMAKRRAELTAEIVSFAERRPELRLRADTLGTMLERAQTETRFTRTESSFLAEGWVPVRALPKLEAALAKYDCAWETEDPTEEEIPEVPVSLRNNPLTRCLNMVTNMYSLPAYNGVDPNPLMAPFFILFYGIMLADMGYGLLMVLAAVIVLGKKKPTGGTRNFVELLLYCGVSTFIWGAITGGLFGDAPLQIARMIDPNTTWAGLPALFSPLEDTVMILVGSMALGLVQIITGMAVSLVEKFKRGEYLDGFFEEITWWIVFAGIGLFVLKVTNLVLYAGIALVVAGPMIQGKGLGKLTGIFGSLYNHVTGFFGDILSYSRLMALMLAGSVIAQVFNTLGASTGSFIAFVPVFLLGHLLNFGLNLLGCYVHDMRLQCLEYFGKFYVDGGVPFTPLDVKSKYYVVNN